MPARGQLRAFYEQMARITIAPTWARYYDFGAGRRPTSASADRLRSEVSAIWTGKRRRSAEVRADGGRRVPGGTVKSLAATDADAAGGLHEGPHYGPLLAARARSL